MPSILIVDDDPGIVEACTLFLERAGHQVTGRHSRPAGEEALEAGAFDLLILDVMMDQPDDGLAMAQDLRRKGNTTPILMLTSLSKVMGLEYGRDDDVVPVDAYLEKPVTPGQLVAAVEELLAAKE